MRGFLNFSKNKLPKFVRGFLKFSRNKIPKRAFRARLPQLFKEQDSKTSISCDASSTFQGTSFQNEHFVRCFLNFSKNKLPKFVRGFNFSSNKLPKRAFRARLPQLLKEKASNFVRCFLNFSRTSFHLVFWLPAARVRVPGGSPFSQLQLHEKDNSTFVTSNKNIHNHWPEQ